MENVVMKEAAWRHFGGFCYAETVNREMTGKECEALEYSGGKAKENGSIHEITELLHIQNSNALLWHFKDFSYIFSLILTFLSANSTYQFIFFGLEHFFH